MNHRGLLIPKTSFGNVSSDNLFGPNDQGVFDFYEANKGRYHRALDIGANIGVHSILMMCAEWEVAAYEPDPVHVAAWRKNVHFHGLAMIEPPVYEIHEQAVSDHDALETFVRVKGNTTGSHLKGDKRPYGELEEFPVDVVDCRPLFEWADFAKIDCEGAEARLLLTTTKKTRCEFMVEIGSRENADAIYDHFKSLDMPMWAQANGWRKVRAFCDVPTHHIQGHLFIGQEPPFK